jgi:hypothetical protein
MTGKHARKQTVYYYYFFLAKTVGCHFNQQGEYTGAVICVSFSMFVVQFIEAAPIPYINPIVRVRVLSVRESGLSVIGEPCFVRQNWPNRKEHRGDILT